MNNKTKKYQKIFSITNNEKSFLKFINNNKLNFQKLFNKNYTNKNLVFELQDFFAKNFLKKIEELSLDFFEKIYTPVIIYKESEFHFLNSEISYLTDYEIFPLYKNTINYFQNLEYSKFVFNEAYKKYMQERYAYQKNYKSFLLGKEKKKIIIRLTETENEKFQNEISLINKRITQQKYIKNILLGIPTILIDEQLYRRLKIIITKFYVNTNNCVNHINKNIKFYPSIYHKNVFRALENFEKLKSYLLIMNRIFKFAFLFFQYAIEFFDPFKKGLDKKIFINNFQEIQNMIKNIN